MIIPTGTYNIEIIPYDGYHKPYKDTIEITEGGFALYPILEKLH